MQKLKNIFLAEKDSWILWFPVFFCIGIVFYFTLPFEPRLIYGITIFLVSSILALTFRKKSAFFLVFLTSAVISSGFVAANIRTLSIVAPVLQKETGIKKITGVVSEIQAMPSGSRFIITNPAIEGVDATDTPEKIRVIVRTNDNGANPGDTVLFLASLSPPPQAAIPGGYDFSRYAFFEQIGAVGYSISSIEVINKSNISDSFIEKVRQKIVNNILENTDPKPGNIAVALLVGEQSGIDKTIRDEWRVSGISHILSISGLHLTLAAAIFYFFSRALLAMIPVIALRFNIKKWAAAIAILSSFAYLLISGAPVPAQRSFIMTSLILIAIIIDRTGAPLRSIAFAAIIILIFMPESALDPSFQMSFASVIALISCYELVSNIIGSETKKSIIKRTIFYFLGIIASSLIAGIATAPFTIYHFNNFSSYGILTNLIAIPITSFIVMPAGVITLLLMPFGLESVGLVPMCWGIELVSGAAKYITSLPQPVSSLPQLPDASLILMAIGGLWFCLWLTKLRYLGAIPVLLGVALAQYTHVPDIIIDESGKLFAVKIDERFVFSNKNQEKYSRETWQKKFGSSETEIIEDEKSGKDTAINCDAIGCIYKKDKFTTVFAKQPLALEEDCVGADVIINFTHTKATCPNARIISLYNLKEGGTHTIFLSDTIEIASVAQKKGDRLWNSR
ncbi:MAG: ComEC family competence protein [Rickettsiaceae bacterium]|jgi:competence protein ComEC|nr:ComEC family competence protein [Rickettsiaceae bacterium]